MAGAHPNLFPDATGLEYVLWILAMFALLLNAWSWTKGLFLGFATIALFIVLVALAMAARPAHGQPYQQQRPLIERRTPPQEEPFTWEEAVRRCERNIGHGPLRQEQLWTCARRLMHPEWYSDR